MVLFPLLDGAPFLIERPEKFGGNVTFASYDAMEKAFGSRELDPVDLKGGVSAALNKLLDPIRKKFEDPKLQALAAKAYPAGEKAKPAKAVKAGKEPKADKGTEGEKKKGGARKQLTPEEIEAKKKEAAAAKAAAPKKDEKKGEAKAAKAVPAAGDYNVSHLNIIVGTILKAWPHPESEKLWCEEIDVGEAEPRQIASGLR